MYGLIYGLSISFLWCVFLFLCQYHTVLMTVALQYSLKSGSWIPQALYFFLKNVLAIQSLLCFHKNFKIFCTSFMKNVLCHLIGIARNLQIALGSIVIFTILLLSIQEHGLSVHTFFSFFISFISVLQFSAYSSFVTLGSFIPRYFILFVSVINVIVS